jgi:hypothetical protein
MSFTSSVEWIGNAGRQPARRMVKTRAPRAHRRAARIA